MDRMSNYVRVTAMVTKVLDNLKRPSTWLYTAGYGVIPFLLTVALVFRHSLEAATSDDKRTFMFIGLGLVPVIVGLMVGGVHQRQREDIAAAQDPKVRLRERTQAVNVALEEAMRLMDELKQDVERQLAARDVLLTQVDEHQKMLELDKDQADKIARILLGETKATIRAERKPQWVFFALGIIASIPVGVVINLWTN